MSLHNNFSLSPASPSWDPLPQSPLFPEISEEIENITAEKCRYMMHSLLQTITTLQNENNELNVLLTKFIQDSSFPQLPQLLESTCPVPSWPPILPLSSVFPNCSPEQLAKYPTLNKVVDLAYRGFQKCVVLRRENEFLRNRYDTAMTLWLNLLWKQECGGQPSQSLVASILNFECPQQAEGALPEWLG